MNNLSIQEKLNSIRNEMTHLWGSIFIVGGGSLALLLNNSGIKDYIIGIIGIFLTMIFINAYFVRRYEVVKIVNNLGEE